MRPAQKVETYPDGIVEIYGENDRKLTERKAVFRFEKQSVGVNRFYNALESLGGNRIDRVIKVPHTDRINRMDIAVIRGKEMQQYRINRIQEKPERGVDLLELQSVAAAMRRKE